MEKARSAILLTMLSLGLGARIALGADTAATLQINFGIASQYVFRGLAQSGGRPVIQGGVDYATPSGVYAGTWLSPVRWVADSNAGVRSPIECDLYGGYRR